MGVGKWIKKKKKKKQSQHCHHKESQLKKKKVSLGFTGPLAKPHHWQLQKPRAVPGTQGKHPTHFGWECLSLNNAFQYFSWKQKNPVLSLFLAGTFMSWLVLTRNRLNGNHLQMYLSFIAHDCNCFPPGLKPASWSYGLLFWDSSRTISFTICLCSNMDGKRVTAQVSHCITVSYFNSWWGFKPRRYYPKTEQQNDKWGL